jgi:hypothetical protein
MPSKKLFIHVGLGKTATTSIQYMLAFDSFDNIYYPRTGLFCYRHSLLTSLDVWKELHEEIKDLHCSTVVVSSEELIYSDFFFDVYSLHMLKYIFVEYDIHIIGTIRNCEELILSSYSQQMSRIDNVVDTTDFVSWLSNMQLGFRFDVLFHKFACIFGQLNVHILVYTPDHIVYDFF